MKPFSARYITGNSIATITRITTAAVPSTHAMPINPATRWRRLRRQGRSVLLADGSAPWVTSPNVGPNNDNIWTIGSDNDRLATYTGHEVPTSLRDVFMCP